METITFQAVYENGILKPKIKLDFPEGSIIDVQVASEPFRGSAKAIVRHMGSLKLGHGEINAIISDIEHLRKLDLESNA